ncbi:TraB/GumN family protein [Brevundimonas naejangsanensis]|uniref:TraB/GumN family protein n=1 Tax=Brevundimonas naejangsanensis TaxID=588932 RepID=A0A494RM72_9CAUL|nr:TraB/GumN family protein [Brevundimonas naejangsanensis]AYG96013.1 TraB/GumN family protein [Brevundimonas naejangsanensis]
MPPFSRLRLLALAVAVGLSVAPLPASAQPTAPAPALWVVRDHDSTIYLFGTIHFVKPEQAWRSEPVDAAFTTSTRLILEVADPEDQAAVAPLIPRYGLTPDRPLSSLLSSEELQRLDAAAAAIGGSAAQMDIMRPWLAGVMLSSAGLVRNGYAPGAGVDVLLRAQARADAKPIEGLETPEQQVRMLAGFPEEGQIAFLKKTLDDFHKPPVELDRLAHAWAAGDVDAIADITLKPMREGNERLYQILIVERNQRWARQIADLLDGSGTVFVAVGALHLAGEDSVQAILREGGIDIKRLPGS